MMKQTRKSICSVLLAAAMLIASVFPAMTVSAAEETPVDILFHDCESTGNITVFNGYSMAADNDCTEGQKSVSFSTEATGTTFQIAVNANAPKDITGAKYIVFDLYTQDPKLFTYSDRGIEFIDSSNVNSGRMGTTESLGKLTLTAGWNHIQLELGAYSDTFNPKALNQISLFAVAQPGAVNIKIDNIRIANDGGLAAIDHLVQGFTALNEGYNCFAAQNIDDSEFTQGSSCLSATTFTGYANMEVIVQNTQSYDFSAITYMVFDLKTDDVNLFKNASDCAVSFFNGDSFSGRAVTAQTLKALTLVPGWNHIVVPFSYTEAQSNFSKSAITKYTLYIFYAAGYADGQVYKYDNFRICNYEGLKLQEKAYDVVSQINSIGTVTAESKTAVAAARTAYNDLNDSQKDVVNNYSTLVAAEARLAELAADQAAADAVMAAIGKLPDPSAVNPIKDKEAIAAADAAYSALTDTQKALVSAESTTKLEACKNALTAVRYGDVNEDGILNTTDALLTLRAAINKINFSDHQKVLADVNGDNAVNTTDALQILKKSIDPAYVFPVEQK